MSKLTILGMVAACVCIIIGAVGGYLGYSRFWVLHGDQLKLIYSCIFALMTIAVGFIILWLTFINSKIQDSIELTRSQNATLFDKLGVMTFSIESQNAKITTLTEKLKIHRKKLKLLKTKYKTLKR